MKKLENLIQELKTLGFSKEQVQEIIEIAEKDIIDSVLEDFALNAPEERIQEYTQKFANTEKNPEKLNNLLHEIMGLQYGEENIEKKKEDLLTEYIKNIIELTKQTKEVYQKYSQGDKETVKAVEEAKKSPIVKELSQKDKS